VAGQIVQGVLYVILAWSVGTRLRPGWDGTLAREIVGYGANITGASLVLLLLLNVDYVIVGRRLGASSLGVYSLAFRICYLPYISLSYVINGAAFPFYCRLPSRQELSRAVPRVVAAVAALTMPLFAGLALEAQHVVLLGQRWEAATGAIRLLAAYGFVLSVLHTGQVVLKAVGAPRLLLVTRTLHLVALTLCLLLTASHGITVVAATQAVVVTAMAVITWSLVLSRAEVSLRELAVALAPPLVGAAGMAAVVAGARVVPAFRDPRSWTALIAVSAAALAVYGLVVLRLLPGRLEQAWALLRGRAPSIDAPAAGAS
jgi:O-antigen/teichoic acid export membrane protein